MGVAELTAWKFDALRALDDSAILKAGNILRDGCVREREKECRMNWSAVRTGVRMYFLRYTKPSDTMETASGATAWER